MAGKVGRPPHEPTEDTRENVAELAGFGIPHESISRILKIGTKTLRANYRSELKHGKQIANAAVAKSLFLAATDKGNVTAMIFWLKAQAGWKEAQAPAVLPPAPEGWNLSGYSRAELLVFERIQKSVAARAALPAAASDPKGIGGATPVGLHPDRVDDGAPDDGLSP